VRVQITERHCRVPRDVTERAESRVASLAKYSPRASHAEVVFAEENVDRIVEVQPWFAGDAIVVLRNGAKLRLSRTYRERLHARLGARSEVEGAVP